MTDLDAPLARIASLEKALRGIAKRHEWTPGLGPCICDEHNAARSALEASAVPTEPKPWDHPYEGSADDPDRCVNCGLVGSYAHTEEFYRKWVGPSGFRYTGPASAVPEPTDHAGRTDSQELLDAGSAEERGDTSAHALLRRLVAVMDAASMVWRDPVPTDAMPGGALHAAKEYLAAAPAMRGGLRATGGE